MISVSLLYLGTLLALAAANPLGRRAMSVHESRHVVPAGFAHAGSPPLSKEITLRIALTNTDIKGLEANTYAVSDPANALYGQHLTPDEVVDYVKPTADTLSAVTGWLKENDLVAKAISPAGDLLQISLPISKANDLLSAQFATFKHVASGKESIRTLSYSIPESLKGEIQFFHPTVAFIPPLKGVPRVTAINSKRELKERATVPASCASVANPACLIAEFNIPTAPANNSASNNLVVAGYIEQYANQADLQRFLAALRPDLGNATFALQTLDDGTNDQTLSNGGVEANLDVDMTVGLAGGVPVTFLSVGENNNDDVDGFVDIVNFLLTEPDGVRPTVLTTSYGFNEEDLPASLAINICNAYMQLGAVGTSVFFASGDGGVSGIQSTSCTTFVPTAPSVCPFVTSVGGTAGAPQSAAGLSGGGFSNYFTTPDYQAADVASYLSSIGTQYSGLYNASGRGFPDIAATAENVEIAWEGSFWTVDGTSCATPISASIFALVNDRLIAAGKPVLGFLNPFLYSETGRAAFNDITSGSNPGCNTEGFSAEAGWDPVTGLGTPDFNKLLTAVGL
ncbi:family S53 protease-like protein [Mycena alexandri]|uniref:Family S53 protease-like protein n=1 Tax=Mycena alexandri TaxID=1745969 RepID=A0AAD6SNP1_9AGAR|nr:family S53 protease-like protein [Mycena alexandri]